MERIALGREVENARRKMWEKRERRGGVLVDGVVGRGGLGDAVVRVPSGVDRGVQRVKWPREMVPCTGTRLNKLLPIPSGVLSPLNDMVVERWYFRSWLLACAEWWVEGCFSICTGRYCSGID